MGLRSKTLVIVSKSLAPYRVRFYSEVANALSSAGWSVILLVAKRGADDHPWKNAGDESQSLRIVEANPDKDSSGLCRKLLCALKQNAPMPNWALIDSLENERPDIVWTHEHSPFCLAAAFWASFRDVPSFISTDLGISPPAYSCSKGKLRFQRMLSFLYQAVIAQTPDATRRPSNSSLPVHFAPHAIDTAEYFPDPAKRTARFRFLFTGALEERKGLDSLIAAGRLLNERGLDFEIRVVGSGSMARWLEKQSAPWLSIAGFREGADLIAEYQSANVYILPTRGDTYAVTVHEAAACALPLIIGNGAGALETLVHEGKSGYLVNPENPAEIAERMALVFEDSSLRDRLGSEARRLAEKFDVKRIGRETAKFLLEQTRDECSAFQVPAPIILQVPASDQPISNTQPSGAIAVAFATMNRSAVAVECLRQLSLQTHLPAKIFVTNNRSTDDTHEALIAAAENYRLPLALIASPENLGNAGGIKLSIERAFKEGYPAVWVLDDDSWPEPDALENLLKKDGPAEGVRCSLVLSPDSEKVSWPCERQQDDRWELVDTVFHSDSAPWVRIRRSWLGILLTREDHEAAGPLNGELFLRGEDEDFPRQLENNGRSFWLATRSILRHPRSGELLILRIAGQRVCLEQNLEGPKLYYRIRNMIWLKKREAGFFAAAALSIGYLALILKEFRPIRPALSRFLTGLVDACQNKLGRLE